ncbi:HAD family phosphatase [Citreicella sp. C3M06]|uniref:HAD family hydrolase n=1 Tax=Citreicella sp. C3M06 TaxID=2841564 RepID=UPI001C08F89C|nr:HAD family phosphatase [Citreicella sp. C3M06]MBU2963768.1 HAD family phosphatase [Citreicella sp. C3M06]
MAISAVIFDIGNVLIRWQPELYYDALIGEERRRAMFDAVDLHAMNEGLDAGEPFRKQVYDCAEAHPEFAAEIRHWHDNWTSLAAPAIDGSVSILMALRDAGVPVFFLSNIGMGPFEQGLEVYPFLREYDRAYISGEMKAVKPHEDIYRMVEEDCGLAPSTLLFADDREDNIATAAARGWQTHVFKHPEGWQDCLLKHGVLQAPVI